MTYSDRELMELFPFVAWRSPQPVRVAGEGHHRLLCRLCVARFGLRASERDSDQTGKWSRSRGEFDAHLKAHHPLDEL